MMENQYYYKLMANYLSKRTCDESLIRYLFGDNSNKKTAEELERADERKRRLQRERSRRYRALKNARRQGEPSRREWDNNDSSGENRRPQRPQTLAPQPEEESLSDGDEPPTLCRLTFDPPPSVSDENSTQSISELREFLAAPNTELDYPTMHSLMFHWLQT